jgi:hypothetical protein
MGDTPKLNFFVTLCPMLPYLYPYSVILATETIPVPGIESYPPRWQPGIRTYYYFVFVFVYVFICAPFARAYFIIGP